jgi:hypothetical protein
MNVFNTSQEVLKSKRIEISLFRQQFNNSLTNLPGKIDTYLNKVDNISANIVGEEFFQDKKRKKVSNERAQKLYLNNFAKKSKIIEQENSKIGNLHKFPKLRRSSVVYNKEMLYPTQIEKNKIAEGIFKNLIASSEDIQKKPLVTHKKHSSKSQGVSKAFISPPQIINSSPKSPLITSLYLNEANEAYKANNGLLINNSSKEKRINKSQTNKIKSTFNDKTFISEMSEIFDEKGTKEILSSKVKQLFSNKLFKKDLLPISEEKPHKKDGSILKEKNSPKILNQDVFPNIDICHSYQNNSSRELKPSELFFRKKIHKDTKIGPIRHSTENNSAIPTLPTLPNSHKLNSSLSNSNNSCLPTSYKPTNIIFKEILSRCENEKANNTKEYDRLQNHIRISHPHGSNRKISFDKKEDKEIYLPDKNKRKCFVYGNNSGVFISDGCSRDTIGYSNLLMKMDPDDVYKLRNVLAEKIDSMVVNSEEGYVDLYENKKRKDDEILQSYSSKLKLKHERVDDILNSMHKKKSEIFDNISNIIRPSFK